MSNLIFKSILLATNNNILISKLKPSPKLKPPPKPLPKPKPKPKLKPLLKSKALPKPNIKLVKNKIVIKPMPPIIDKKIKQIYVSNSLKLFELNIKSTYNLRNYYSKSLPAIFFGCYNKHDLSRLLNHKNLKILIWGGTDCYKIKNEAIRKILKQKQLCHIAISIDIKNKLKKLGFKKIQFIPLSFINVNNFKPFPKGNSVYIYGNPHRPSTYGDSIYKSLMEMLPDINFILATNPTAYNGDPKFQTDRNVINLYQKCFIGLRLTKFDGNANTVQELGLCGIKCVHNSNYPNAIKWKGVEDIKQAILDEQKTIGQIDHSLSQSVKNYLYFRKDWLNSDYYI